LDPEIPFPRGIKSIKRLEQRSADLDAFLGILKHVSVGELDNLRDPALRTTPFLDKVQGKNRVARAKNWLRHIDDAAKAHGIKACREFQLLNQTDHDFTNAVDPEKGDLGQKWIRFFAGAGSVPDL
jgi:hypothetical protein